MFRNLKARMSNPAVPMLHRPTPNKPILQIAPTRPCSGTYFAKSGTHRFYPKKILNQIHPQQSTQPTRYQPTHSKATDLYMEYLIQNILSHTSSLTSPTQMLIGLVTPHLPINFSELYIFGCHLLSWFSLRLSSEYRL